MSNSFSGYSHNKYQCFNCLQFFDAVGRAAGGHLACKKTEWWDAGVVMCLEQGADLHMAQLMPLPLTNSCSSKYRLVLTFWCRLTRVVPDKIQEGHKTLCVWGVCVCSIQVGPDRRIALIIFRAFTCCSITSSMQTTGNKFLWSASTYYPDETEIMMDLTENLHMIACDLEKYFTFDNLIII